MLLLREKFNQLFIVLTVTFSCSTQRHSEIAEDETLKDSETDGNEVPLGKIIKRLKAKGAKARKHVKNESLPVDAKTENEVDILKMVREINVDNLSISNKFESNNGRAYPTKGETDEKHKKKKRVAASESTDVPVPKRQRSSSSSAKGRYKLSLPRSTTKPAAVDNLFQEGASSFESTEMDEQLHFGSVDKMSTVVEGDNPNLPMKTKGKRSARAHKAGGGTRDPGFKASLSTKDFDLLAVARILFLVVDFMCLCFFSSSPAES